MNFRNIEKSQPETIKIVDPFIAAMRKEGWICYNIHGNQFQKGLPDYFCFREGISRWIEFKVCQPPNGYIKLQPAQKKRFPEMYNEGLPVYIVADYDLRNNPRAIAAHYKRIVSGKPNINLTFDKRDFPYLPSGFCKVPK